MDDRQREGLIPWEKSAYRLGLPSRVAVSALWRSIAAYCAGSRKRNALSGWLTSLLYPVERWPQDSSWH